MSRWAKLLWFVAIAMALLTFAVSVYLLGEEPKPSIPQPSGPPLARPTSGGDRWTISHLNGPTR